MSLLLTFRSRWVKKKLELGQLDSGLILSGLSGAEFFFFFNYALQVQVRSDSGSGTDFKTCSVFGIIT